MWKLWEREPPGALSAYLGLSRNSFLHNTAHFMSFLFIKSTGFWGVHEVDRNEYLYGREIKMWWWVAELRRWNPIFSHRISKVLHWFLCMDQQHLNDFDQAWPYTIHNSEKCLRRLIILSCLISDGGEMQIRDIEFHDAVKMITVLGAS